MVLTNDWLYLATAAIALVEIGANVAMIEAFYRAYGKLRYPITGKMLAVSIMLAYIALSVSYGNPAQWRGVIAFIAVGADAFAIAWIWSALTHGRPLFGPGSSPGLSFVDIGEQGATGATGATGADSTVQGPPGPPGPAGATGAEGS